MADERVIENESDGHERVTSIFCLILSVFLGAFAYILGTHRGDVLAEASRKISVVRAVRNKSSTLA